MNIVSMGMKYLGPTVVTKVASMMGLDSPVVVKLITAALPTILAGFAGKAANASGAASLMELVQENPVDTPEGFENVLAGPQAGDVAGAGGDMLADLLGDDMSAKLSGMLGGHAGVEPAQAQSLMGLVAPAALGSLRSQVTENNLDAAGLSTMLADQKTNIAGALPDGFAGELSGLGLFEAPQPTPAATPAPAAAPAPATAPSGGSGGLVKILAAVVIIGGAAWYFLSGNDAPEMPAMPETPDLAALTDGVDLSVGEVDLGEQFTSVVGDISDGFSGITDTASAEAAAPALEAASDQLAGLSDLAGQLPDQAQGVFGTVVTTALGSLRPMIENAIEASGAGSILQPIADKILGSLESMGG